MDSQTNPKINVSFLTVFSTFLLSFKKDLKCIFTMN